MHLTRRLMMAGSPAFLLSPMPADAALALPPRNQLRFTVWRNGSHIGEHDVDFTRSGTGLTVHSTAHFAIGFGPIKLYTYTYEVTETWDADALQKLDAHTNDNGTRATCSITRVGDTLSVTGSKAGQYTPPSASIAGTHWNKAELQAPIINPENGVLMHFAIADKGRDTPPASGSPASHYALSGFATLDLWYDTADTWVGLRAIAKDNSVVEYHQA